MSNIYKELIASQLETTSIKWPQLDLQVPEVDFFLQSYSYPMAACPLVISGQNVHEFTQLAKGLVPIMCQSIKSFFGHDEALFAQYLEEPEWLLSMLHRNAIPEFERLCRYDVVVNQHEVKVIEVNSGCSLGGWQHDSFASLYESSFQDVAPHVSGQVVRKPVFEQQMLAMQKAISRKTLSSGKGDILFYIMGDLDSQETRSAMDFIKTCHKKANPQTAGRVLFFNDFSRLRVDQNTKQVFYDNHRIDALHLALPEGVTVPSHLMMQLCTCAMEGKLVLPDNPVLSLLGNKMLFAVLYEPKAWEALGKEFQAFITQYIPWTARLASPTVIRHTEVQPLEQILLAEKDNLVIKKAKSFMGRDVFIGRQMSQSDWQLQIDRVKNHEGWLVQEYCEPSVTSATDQYGTVKPFQMIWGVFDFGNAYGGAFVRGKEVSANTDGVINSACGAVEFIVFDEKPKRKLIKI
ncbi:hypothetical protein L1077_00380 [Pseudoalteromonas luteoviolacea]|uniref:hypothetical protein n=1 Tax=Pseudoalteromonas luteoviolacea TaxID=43657 RepID=UPI001F2D8263|nr:hypothetical protein [Pseudoalteromonas luteoviolacea]MCF6437889.1 hypothetical protein [Pseudoalteromonas luteoviolacea]